MSHLWCGKFGKLNVYYSKYLNGFVNGKGISWMIFFVNGDWFCDVENLESWMQNVENVWFGW